MSQSISKRRSFPFRVRIEPRMEQPSWLSLVISLGALLVSLIIGGIILAIVGGDPIRAYRFMIDAAFGNSGVPW